MKLVRGKSLLLKGAIALALTLAFVVWIVVSLHNDDSILSIGVKEIPLHMGWAQDSTTFDALRRMSNYEKKGHYDDAIQAGSCGPRNTQSTA